MQELINEGLSNKCNEDEDNNSVFSFNFFNDEPTNISNPKKKPSYQDYSPNHKMNGYKYSGPVPENNRP